MFTPCSLLAFFVDSLLYPLLALNVTSNNKLGFTVPLSAAQDHGKLSILPNRLNVCLKARKLLLHLNLQSWPPTVSTMFTSSLAAAGSLLCPGVTQRGTQKKVLLFQILKVHPLFNPTYCTFNRNVVVVYHAL